MNASLSPSTLKCSGNMLSRTWDSVKSSLGFSKGTAERAGQQARATPGMLQFANRPPRQFSSWCCASSLMLLIAILRVQRHASTLQNRCQFRPPPSSCRLPTQLKTPAATPTTLPPA